MPAYKAESYIERAIESVLAQTYTDFELIVYVDGSPDATTELAEGYVEGDERVRVIDNEENVGLCVALNRAIALSHGDYVGRMDADDISLPERFERQMALIESHPEIVVVGSDAMHIDTHDEVLGLSIAGPRSVADFHDRRARGELTVVLDGTSVMRRDVFDLVGGYDPVMAAAAEVDLHSKMAAHGVVVAIDEPLLLYRLHPGSSVDTRFFEGRGIHRYVEARDRAMLRGETPLSYEEFLAGERSAPLVRRVGIRLSDVSQYHYRAAGVYLSEGRKGRAVFSLGRAFVADPAFVTARAWHRRFSPEARRQLRDAVGE
jgi:glycosyltransferase involved in cell wall biosynthesis